MPVYIYSVNCPKHRLFESAHFPPPLSVCVCVCLCTKTMLPGVPGLPLCIDSSGGGSGTAPTLTSRLCVTAALDYPAVQSVGMDVGVETLKMCFH